MANPDPGSHSRETGPSLIQGEAWRPGELGEYALEDISSRVQEEVESLPFPVWRGGVWGVKRESGGR